MDMNPFQFYKEILGVFQRWDDFPQAGTAQSYIVMFLMKYSAILCPFSTFSFAIQIFRPCQSIERDIYGSSVAVVATSLFVSLSILITRVSSKQYPKPPDKYILGQFSKGSNQNTELMLSRLRSQAAILWAVPERLWQLVFNSICQKGKCGVKC